MISKRRYGILEIVTITVILAWTATAMGMNIQVGGGQKLDLTSFSVVHQETFDSNQTQETAFWGALDIGERPNDPWSGVLAKGAYVLTHTGNPGAVRYYFRYRLEEHADEGLSAFPVSVEVAGTMNDDISGAGLIYGYDPQSRYYLAFVKGAGNTYAIYNRNAEGFRKVVGGSSRAIKPNRSNQLAIVPEGSKIKFCINGVQIAMMADEGATSGGAGLVAISSGMYMFDNFTIYRKPRGVESPQIQGHDDQISMETSQSGGQAQTNNQAIKSSSSPHQSGQRTKSQRNALHTYRKVLQVGMTKQQVVEMFGPPDWEKDNRVIYSFRPHGLGVDLDNLIIEYDDNDKVTRFRNSPG